MHLEAKSHSNTKPEDIAFHACSQLAKVISKMIFWFPITTAVAILAAYAAAAPTQTKKIKFSFASFRNTVSLGAFHLTKNSGLHFWKFPVANGTAFAGISRRDNLAKYTETSVPVS